MPLSQVVTHATTKVHVLACNAHVFCDYRFIDRFWLHSRSKSIALPEGLLCDMFSASDSIVRTSPLVFICFVTVSKPMHTVVSLVSHFTKF